MAIKVFCFGNTEKGLYTELLKEYHQRIVKYTSFSWEELSAAKQKKSSEKWLDKEADLLLKRIRPNDHLCLLDEGGKQFSSRGFAAWLNEEQNQLSADLVFVIGSAYGFSSALKERANSKISLSKLTFNHQMVRGIFAEQLYRALNINNGGNYHND